MLLSLGPKEIERELLKAGREGANSSLLVKSIKPNEKDERAEKTETFPRTIIWGFLLLNEVFLRRNPEEKPQSPIYSAVIAASSQCLPLKLGCASPLL